MFQQVINTTYEVIVPGKEHTTIYELKDCSNKCNAEIRFITTPEQMTIQSRIELEEGVWMDAYKYVLDISRRDPSPDLSFMISNHAHAAICLIATGKLFQPICGPSVTGSMPCSCNKMERISSGFCAWKMREFWRSDSRHRAGCTNSW